MFCFFINLLQVSTSEELIKKECILAEEMLYKTITKAVIVSVPYYLGLYFHSLVYAKSLLK